jgi:aminopeptidase N
MRLVINRSQADVKGVFGGHKGVQFTLYTQVQFTDEETDLLNHYKLWDYSVMTRNQMPVTIRTMAEGDRQTLQSVEVLLSNEEVVKSALDKVPPLLKVLRSFGGNTVIDYPRSEQA